MKINLTDWNRSGQLRRLVEVVRDAHPTLECRWARYRRGYKSFQQGKVEIEGREVDVW